MYGYPGGYNPNGNRTVEQPAPVYTPSVGGCKVEGCTCKDARILSRRKLEFFRALAQQRGQTVDRVIRARPVDLSKVLVRPDEPSNVESEDKPKAIAKVPGKCACNQPGCECLNLRTIAFPTACHECLKGAHVYV